MIFTGEGIRFDVSTHHVVLLYEADEGRPLDLDGLAAAVVEGDDEVEEVGLAEVARRLLLEVRPAEP